MAAQPLPKESMYIMADIPPDDPNFDTIEFAVQLTTAWLANPNTRASETDVLAFLKDMHGAVDQLSRAEPDVKSADVANEYTPAVSVRKSLASKDHIISMIDGKPYKTLRRHLAGYGLTPQGYRDRYGLKSDYPMVAESYSEARRAMAKKIGLGRKPGMTRSAGGANGAPATSKSKRKSATSDV